VAIRLTIKICRHNPLIQFRFWAEERRWFWKMHRYSFGWISEAEYGLGVGGDDRGDPDKIPDTIGPEESLNTIRL
jgi:hypothetical protein